MSDSPIPDLRGRYRQARARGLTQLDALYESISTGMVHCGATAEQAAQLAADVRMVASDYAEKFGGLENYIRGKLSGIEQGIVIGRWLAESGASHD